MYDYLAKIILLGPSGCGKYVSLVGSPGEHHLRYGWVDGWMEMGKEGMRKRWVRRADFGSTGLACCTGLSEANVWFISVLWRGEGQMTNDEFMAEGTFADIYNRAGSIFTDHWRRVLIKNHQSRHRV